MLQPYRPGRREKETKAADDNYQQANVAGGGRAGIKPQ